VIGPTGRQKGSEQHEQFIEQIWASIEKAPRTITLLLYDCEDDEEEEEAEEDRDGGAHGSHLMSFGNRVNALQSNVDGLTASLSVFSHLWWGGRAQSLGF
jgi:hypothetical protein